MMLINDADFSRACHLYYSITKTNVDRYANVILKATEIHSIALCEKSTAANGVIDLVTEPCMIPFSVEVSTQ